MTVFDERILGNEYGFIEWSSITDKKLMYVYSADSVRKMKL